MSSAAYIVMENIMRQFRYLLGMTLLLGALVAFTAGFVSILGASPVTGEALTLLAGGLASGIVGAILALGSS